MAKPLTPKQQRFVEEYIVDFNGKQAAIRAGYSEKTAEVQASRLLSNAKVAGFVAEAKEKLSKRTEITQEMVVAGLHKEATFTGDGSTHGARVSAWGLLGKHTGGFADRQEITGKDGGPVDIVPHVIRLVGPDEKKQRHD